MSMYHPPAPPFSRVGRYGPAITRIVVRLKPRFAFGWRFGATLLTVLYHDKGIVDHLLFVKVVGRLTLLCEDPMSYRA